MTDNEIIKALGCCQHRSDVIICNSNCPLFEWCEDEDNDDNVCNLALDLINRQEQEKHNLEVELKAMRGAANSFKAENERLKNAYKQCAFERDAYIEIENTAIAEAKAEAYKEFAERLKERKYQSSDWSHGEHPYVVEESDIDDVYEEMVGDGNEN